MNVAAVWAPRARSMELVLGEARTAMRRCGNDWWRCEAELGHGQDYAFSIDGAEPLPDPRSPWQPHGVHAASRWVDHSLHQWQDCGWRPPSLESALIYELHVGTFTTAGTFDGVSGQLEYLSGLGVTHVELMPVAAFPGARGWGYDGVDLYAPHEPYGGPEGLKRLVESCHANGLAVLLDVVYNHLGPDGNYLSRFGPYFTDRYRTPWGESVNLDGAGSDEVRRYFIDNALMWLRDYHIDGLRLDAVHAIFDQSAVHFLEQLAAEVRGLEAVVGRGLCVIAESDLNDPRLVRPVEAGGYGLDAHWNDDFHHAVHAYLTGEHEGYYADFGRLEQIAAVLERGYVHDGGYSPFRGRAHGRPASGVPAHRLVACLQNHDQVGNRAVGDRLGHRVSAEQLMVAAAVLLTGPELPLLFQGEEWNAGSPFLYFTDHEDPALGEAVRQGRRREFAAFGWDPQAIPDPQAEESFVRSKLDWSELEQPRNARVLHWYRRLIELRKQQPELAAGVPAQVRCDEGAKWLVVTRGSWRIACNFATEDQLIPLQSRQVRLVLASRDGVTLRGAQLLLPAYSAAILQMRIDDGCDGTTGSSR